MSPRLQASCALPGFCRHQQEAPQRRHTFSLFCLALPLWDLLLLGRESGVRLYYNELKALFSPLFDCGPVFSIWPHSSREQQTQTLARLVVLCNHLREKIIFFLLPRICVSNVRWMLKNFKKILKSEWHVKKPNLILRPSFFQRSVGISVTVVTKKLWFFRFHSGVAFCR